MMVLGLNVFELICGAVFGFAPALLFFSKPAGAVVPVLFFTVPLCSYLWAWTGAGHGAVWRKVVMPAFVCVAIFVVRHHWQVFIGLPFMMGILSMGYGIPSTMPQDPGSPLGRFWWKRTKGATEKEHQDAAELRVRATIWGALALCFIPALL